MWLGRELGLVLLGAFAVLGVALIVVLVLLTLWVVNRRRARSPRSGTRPVPTGRKAVFLV
jgi:hypothetical protein